jgi:hypothetical protein
MPVTSQQLMAPIPASIPAMNHFMPGNNSSGGAEAATIVPIRIKPTVSAVMPREVFRRTWLRCSSGHLISEGWRVVSDHLSDHRGSEETAWSHRVGARPGLVEQAELPWGRRLGW